MTIIIFEFLIFGFVGWVIDSGYRSFLLKKFVHGGFFRAPICPIYGIGGLVLISFFEYFVDFPVRLLILSAGLGMVLVEYIGGLYCEKVLQIKLWDYSQSKFNFGGYVDLIHFFYWLVLSALFYFFIFPKVMVLEGLIHIPRYFDLPVILIFLFILTWFTIRKVPARFLEIKEEVLNLSLADYQELVADIKKYYRLKTEETKIILHKGINERLEKIGTKLKK